MAYWVQENENADLTAQNNRPNSPISPILGTGKFTKKWRKEFKWKQSYYKYDLSDCKLFITKDNNSIIISRSVTDSRRFLSAAKRLDMQLTVVDLESGETKFEKIHECYYDADDQENIESGFDILSFHDRIVAMSFVTLIGKNEGFTSMDIYNSSGSLVSRYQNKRRNDLDKLIKRRVISIKARRKVQSTESKPVLTEKKASSFSGKESNASETSELSNQSIQTSQSLSVSKKSKGRKDKKDCILS